MVSIEDLYDRQTSIAVIGMGYVGMPMAVELAQKFDIIGFDINKTKIDMYKRGIDPTEEVGNDKIQKCKVRFSSDERDLDQAKVFIVAVPTPINHDKTPDLFPVISASELVARHLSKDAVVVYESTVYPGVTEDECVPVLERVSGLECIKEFKVGYSPERINPGDKTHTFKNIQKIVSGIDQESLTLIGEIYASVIEAGVYPVSSIKVAEAAKVVENSQRDINIAFMNELAMVFDRMGINTNEVVDAMNTKWNALGFRPGLVGGHCIGVDPYYFVYEAEKLGYHSQIVLSGRRINDSMAEFVGQAIIKNLIKANKMVSNAKVAILGITFKENCPDIRNTKVIDIVHFLKDYGVEPVVCDPVADCGEVKREFGLNLVPDEQLENIDCFVFAVAHNAYKNNYHDIYNHAAASDNCVVIDVKGFAQDLNSEQTLYWSL